MRDEYVAHSLPRVQAFLFGPERRGHNLATRGLSGLSVAALSWLGTLTREPDGDIALVAFGHAILFHVALALRADAQLDPLERA